jgi:hypothetical protein
MPSASDSARLAQSLTDRRGPARVSHRLDEMIKTRAFAICCGHPDGTISTS